MKVRWKPRLTVARYGMPNAETRRRRACPDCLTDPALEGTSAVRSRGTFCDTSRLGSTANRATIRVGRA